MAMTSSERTSAGELDRSIPGSLLKGSSGRPWKDLLVQIFSRNQVQDCILVPAVPEPLIVWVLSGSAIVEERERGSAWQASHVTAGDFFLTHTKSPYEMRWKATGTESFQVMHFYLGLPLLKRALKDVFGEDMADAGLRDVSGQQDEVLSVLLEQLRRELTSPRQPSALFVQGIAQGIAVHLLRSYSDPRTGRRRPAGGLPAFKLRKVTDLMETQLDQDFRLERLARAAGLSDFHFCRMFKQSTGYSPSGYFIRLRMEKARRLLRETEQSVIDIGLCVGYSSPSHFSQVFRRDAGVTPSEYRSRL